MKRGVLSLLIVAAIGLAWAMSGFTQDYITHVEDTGFAERSRPKVAFNHDEHNEMAEIWDCAICHHVYDENNVKIEDETSEDRECSECHMSAGDDSMTLATRYHQRCKGCHQMAKAGPVQCGECHRRP